MITGFLSIIEFFLISGMDITLLGEINCFVDVKFSLLIGNSDFILSNGFILIYLGFSSIIGCVSGMSIFLFFFLSYVMFFI